MPMAEELVHELKHESAVTRKVLEVVPEEKFSYRPHDKSMSLTALCSHMVESLGWAEEMCTKDVFEMKMSEYVPYVAETSAGLLTEYDKQLEIALNSIGSVSDEAMMVTWTMIVDGKTMFAMPRMVMIRGFILSHMIHHRGQLSVYLRLLDVPVPQIYGPTADFPDM